MSRSTPKALDPLVGIEKSDLTFTLNQVPPEPIEIEELVGAQLHIYDEVVGEVKRVSRDQEGKLYLSVSLRAPKEGFGALAAGQGYSKIKNYNKLKQISK